MVAPPRSFLDAPLKAIDCDTPLTTVVHQVIPNFVSGDASSLAALHLRRLLRRLGHAGEIYTLDVEPALSSLVKPVSLLRPTSEDWVLYHHGIASPLSGTILHLRCRRAVVYHNITPARLYPRASFGEALVSGRAQLKAMANHLDVAIADSEFNAQELRANGYQNVHVVPLFVDPERFASDQADPPELKRLRQKQPVVLSVGRVLPHKRFEDLLALQAELLRLQPHAQLVIAGEYQPGNSYFRQLRMRVCKLKNVEFLGKVPHPQLIAAYRAASVFVSMSEHEGFGVPLVEAMAAEVPVRARPILRLGGPAQLRTRAAVAERALQALKSALPLTSRLKVKKAQRRRVAIVIQRYGDVIGGAELLARWVAQRLSARWDMTVLTTCAKDHLSWANEFPAGGSRDGQVRVIRFPCERSRDLLSFNALSGQLFARPTDYTEEERWVAEQGPLVPGLMRHLDEHQGDFAAFIFFTYLYASTVWGLPLVGKRAILVPTVHDEPPLRFGVYREVFSLPSAMLCSTPEEQALIHQRFPQHARTRIAGVGIDQRPGIPSRFRKRFHLASPYLMYVGRIEAGKGIRELLRCYASLRRELQDPPELVLGGSGRMTINQPGVRCLGPISEQEKLDGLAGAAAAVVPSRYESLSLLALEAFSQATPVLANGESEVLSGHIERSGAGFTYLDAASFIEGFRKANADRERLGRRGLTYARRHSWKRVLDVYEQELARIQRGSQ